GMAVAADDLRQHVARKHRGTLGGLRLHDDLQQDRSRQVFLGLGILDLELDVFEHQLLDVFESDVLARRRIVETAVRILFQNADRVGHKDEFIWTLAAAASCCTARRNLASAMAESNLQCACTSAGHRQLLPRRAHCMCWPPLIAMLAPVTNAASSE